MKLRSATATDAKALSALAAETYAAAFGHSMSPDDLAAHLEKHFSPEGFERILSEDRVLVAELQGRMAGFVQFGRAGAELAEDASDADWELRRLYVRAEVQNRGVGTRLMDAALAQLEGAERIFLDVWEHNAGALRFYARYGFKVVGERAFEVASGAKTSRDLLMLRRQAGETRAPRTR